MKERIEKKTETFVYGILSLLFGAAFFFGVLYPARSISPNAYKVIESHSDINHPRKMKETIKYDPKEIRYTFYIYERLKNS